MISVVAFDQSEAFAREQFQKWVDSLWFAPTGFKKHVESTHPKKVYIPFYIVSAHAMTTWKCEVGFDHEVEHHGKKEQQHHDPHKPKEMETCWERASGARQKTYKNLQFCADVDTSLWPLLKKAGGFTVDGHVSSSQPSVLVASSHYINKWQSWGASWSQTVEPNLQKSEKDHCNHQVRQERHPDHVRNMRAKTHLTDISYCMAFFPFYVMEYFESASDDQARLFVVNGQSGKYDGKRPSVGLGKLGDYKKGVGNFFSTMFGNKTIEMLPGEELMKLDNVRSYDENSYYLALPRSDSYIFAGAMGWVYIKNDGDVPMKLEAQKRRGSERGGSVVLQPGDKFATDYYGHWVIRIASGLPNDLKVLDGATKGGGKGDKLGMGKK